MIPLSLFGAGGGGDSARRRSIECRSSDFNGNGGEYEHFLSHAHEDDNDDEEEAEDEELADLAEFGSERSDTLWNALARKSSF